jgi:phosphoglycolate phosphatase-like HAD superfamily hydrolase
MNNDVKMKLILTDCDGVLLDWESKFIEWMGSKGFKPDPNQFGYEMAQRFGMKKPKVKELIREFNESAWIGFLGPHKDAVWGMEQLSAKGYTFGAVTSLSEDVYAKKMREMNLAELFPTSTFEFVECIDTGADKDQSLLPYKDSGMFWIEDKPENAQLGADLGLNAIMLRHKHNAHFDDARVKVVDNWAQLVNYVN